MSISQANASIKQVDLEWSEISLVCRSGDQGPWLEAPPLFRTGATEMTSSAASLEEDPRCSLFIFLLERYDVLVKWAVDLRVGNFRLINGRPEEFRSLTLDRKSNIDRDLVRMLADLVEAISNGETSVGTGGVDGGNSFVDISSVRFKLLLVDSRVGGLDLLGIESIIVNVRDSLGDILELTLPWK